MLIITLISHAARSGGGFGPTNTYRFGGFSFLGKCVDRSISNVCTAIPAFANSAAISAAFSSGPPAMRTPNTIWPICAFATCHIAATPDFPNMVASWVEYDHASASEYWYSISKSISSTASWRAAEIWSRCSGDVCRQAETASISATRSLASAASFSSFAARSSDRRDSSSEHIFDRWPKKTSKITPEATRLSAITAPISQRMDSRGTTLQTRLPAATRK